MRASVARRWTEYLPDANRGTLDELTHFNEAIDQAASEAVAWYVDRVEESRNLLLDVRGHDLRNPLGAVRNASTYLLHTDGLTSAQTKAVARIVSSTTRMQQRDDDLLNVTRTRLGTALFIAPARRTLTRRAARRSTNSRRSTPSTHCRWTARASCRAAGMRRASDRCCRT